MKKRVFTDRFGNIYFPFRYDNNGAVVYIMKGTEGDEHSFNFCISKACCDVSCDFKVTTSKYLLSPVIVDKTERVFNIIDSDEKVNIAGSRFTIKEHRGGLCVCPASGEFLTFWVKLPKEALEEYFNVVDLIVKGLEV